jgi:GNAT superfamily N-acetyltransferase
MIRLAEDCSLHRLSDNRLIKDFVCDSKDLNDFFSVDAIKYQEQLLGETFFYRLNETKEILCAYTISNDSIRTDNLPSGRRNKVKEYIPHIKSLKSYPALLIGRLGVSIKYEGRGLGSQLLKFIKAYCLSEVGSKCRFIIVDAYNTEKALALYNKNEFKFVFSSEDQEKVYYGKKPQETLRTRFMYFDLKLWKDKLSG